jgi:hypothetical protein
MDDHQVADPDMVHTVFGYLEQLSVKSSWLPSMIR